MKKLLSLFFAMIFVLSLTTAAFAASSTLKLGETVSLSLENGESASFTFTASETAVYRLAFVIKNRSFSECKIYSPESTDYKNAGSVKMHYSDKDEKSLTPGTYVCINEGTEITFTVEETGSKKSSDIEKYDLSTTAELDMTLSKASVGKMIPAEVYTAKSYYAARYFIPEVSGYYNFRSFSTSEEYDPYIRIYDENGLYHSDDDTGYNGDVNYDTNVYLEAGSVYLINPRVRTYDEDGEANDTPDIPIEYTYMMTDASKIAVESYQLGSEYIEMTGKNYYVNPVYVIPGGAAASINAEDVTVTSSNPRVADVYDVRVDDGAICITVASFKAGSADFAVELPDGEQMEFSVKVKSRFVALFKNLFSTLLGKIKGLFNR